MPNSLAYLVLALWPVVCLILFRRLSRERALIWSILGAYLLLPPEAAFDLPLVPPMDKFSLPSVSALAALILLREPLQLLPRTRAVSVLVVLFLLSVIPTVLTNPDPIEFALQVSAEPIRFTTAVLPGLSLRDLLSVAINQVIVLVPFLLARQFLGSAEGLRALLVALVVAGLAYSLPSLLEIRISPQINIWVYGFFQHDFSQMIRQGGFRPIVFLPHGLWLAFFLLTSVLAAAALARDMQGLARRRMLLAMLYLGAVLILCKSLASQVYLLTLTPLVLWASPRWQLRAVLAIAVLAITYPMLRNLELIPLDAILAQADAFSAERGQSLGYRFDNEEALLARADAKPWFGWGGWGRNLVRHPESAEILSIPDGRWIIVFGSFGWVGYIGEMGLLAAPLILLARLARRQGADRLSPHVMPLAVMLAATLADMLLNATLIPFTWLCAGAVLGYVERQGAREPGGSAASRAAFAGDVVIGGPRDKPGRRTVL